MNCSVITELPLELVEEKKLDILTVRLGDLADAYLVRVREDKPPADVRKLQSPEYDEDAFERDLGKATKRLAEPESPAPGSPRRSSNPPSDDST